MKKLYSLAFIFCAFIIKSQNLTFSITSTSTGSTVVTNNEAFNQTTTPNATDEHDFMIVNSSASTQTFTVRRNDNLLNTSGTHTAAAHFCTGLNCYLPATTSTNVVLTAAGTGTGSAISLAAELDEISVVGQSNVSYEIENANNHSDNLTFVLLYNAPAGIKEISTYFSNISQVYPNPSASKSFIDITTLQGLNNINISVLNLLGSVVSSKQIDLDKGKNKVVIDSDNLESGIYFVSISIGTSRITKKITVSK